MIEAFIIGAILALGLILPLGPQNIYIFNQGANHKSFWKAFPAVCSAAICDSILILCAIGGVSLFLLTSPILKTILLSTGILFLLYMSYQTRQQRYRNQSTNNGSAQSKKQQILYAMGVSLLNPHAILDTIAVIGSSSSQFQGKEKIIFTASCIAVSWIRFSLLAYTGKSISTLGNAQKILYWINCISVICMLTVALLLMQQLRNSF